MLWGAVINLRLRYSTINIKDYKPKQRLGRVCIISFTYPATCGPKGHDGSTAAAEAASVFLLQIGLVLSQTRVSVIVGALISIQNPPETIE